MRWLAPLVLAGCATFPASVSLEVRVAPEAVQGDEVQVYIKARGTGTTRLRVELARGIPASRREVAARDLSLKGEETLMVGFTARDRGLFKVCVRVGDDVREAPLHVTSRRLRVLYVEHPPRYEYRFIKNALIRDPEIQAHCFLTSADEGFPQEHSKDEDPFFRDPLTKFPPDLRTLLEFDVLIFGDVDPAALGPQAGRNIDAFVREFGGGILFISGMMHNPCGLTNTPLAALLPVVPGEALPDHEKLYEAIYGYVLTPKGRTSPITNFKEFGGDRDRNLRHWEDPDGQGMLGIRWFQRVKGLKPGATSLVEIRGAGSERRPLFVTMQAGRGRVFWSGTDETWLWRKLVGDHPWFYPFWRAAIEWAARGE